MKGRFLLAFALIGLAAIAGTKSYTVNLLETATVGNMELKPGPYKVEVGDNKAVIHYGKLTAEVPVKVVTSDSKYDKTSFRMNYENGRHLVEEIHLGGTKTKLVLGESSSASAGQ